jgi:sugar lactone lactonase YvrE
MSRIRVGLVSLLLTSGLVAVNAQQYGISTYAGGVPGPPSAAFSIAADPFGNLYFVDGHRYNFAPSQSNSVFKIDPSGFITRVAGNSRTGFSGDGAPAMSASLTSPRGVTADSAGNVFIVDAGNQRVRCISADGIITTIAGGGSAVLGDGGPATKGQLNYPNSIAFDSRGNLFIGELGRVRKVAADGTITTVAGGGSNNPGDGGPATSARLFNALRVAVDRAGNLFVADENYDDDTESYGYRIRKVSPDGIISTLSPIVQPCCYRDMTADAAGNLFVAAGPAVLKVSPDGAQTVVAGNGSYGAPSGDGGPATQAQLNGVAAVAVDASGNLFIADNSGTHIRKITPDGIIRAVASIPTFAPIVSGDGGPAISAQLQLAVPGLSAQGGLAADSAGNLYIAETGAHRVRKVSPSGSITTVAGSGAQRCSGPSTCLPLGDGGPATSAALYYPTSVAVDSGGNLFIADSSNLRVRKVSSDGIITTVVGNGSAPPWPRTVSSGGPATDTPIIPTHVAVDGAGNLYIAEGHFAEVRKVSPDGIISTALIPGTALPYFRLISASTVDRTGNLFVAGSICDDDDNCSLAIRKVSPAGGITIIAIANPLSGQPGSGVGDGEPASRAQVGFVSGLAVDGAGNVFISDLFGQRVRKIDLDGIITTIGGNGLAGYSGDGGPATNGSLYSPLALAVDATGGVYVSDFNQAVRLLRPVAR